MKNLKEKDRQDIEAIVEICEALSAPMRRCVLTICMDILLAGSGGLNGTGRKQS